MLTRVHHVGLVVRRLEDGLALWRDRLGLEISAQATVVDQGVKAALLPIGRSEIELLEPIDERGGVAKFLEKRGEGLHHLCFETPDVGAELAAARERGFPLIDETPRPGLAGMICFLHPKGTAGVLVEFATPPGAAAHHAPAGGGPLAGLALGEVRAHSRDGAAAAALFASRLGLGRHGETAVAVGGVRLRYVPADGPEGLGGQILEVKDLVAAQDALGPLSPTATGDGIALATDRCHGVPIIITAH
jgi:methylmalonyl-CoA/ethylmalonyl-CoA epimerase